MHQVEIQTAQNVALRYELAGVGDRILAFLLDGLIAIAYVVLMALVTSFIPLTGPAESVLGFATIMPVLLYHFVCEAFWNGQSVGKKVRQIRVIRLDGQEPSAMNYFLRWLLRLVDFWLTNGLAALVSILATKNGQRLGDLAAGTTVVSLKKRRDLRETVFQHIEADYTIVFPQVDLLTEADVALVKEAYNLLVADGYSARARQVGADLKSGLQARLGVTTDLPPLAFARTVLRDYNALHGVVE